MSRPSFLEMRIDAVKREAEKKTEQQMEKMGDIMQQYMYDTFCVTMHEDFGFGYDRISAIGEKWEETFNAYRQALTVDDEADVMQEKLDMAIKRIVGDKGEFYPFKERYPEIIRRGYEPKRRK